MLQKKSMIPRISNIIRPLGSLKHPYIYYLKYLAPKAKRLRLARRPGSTLTRAVKQPYSVCCLTGYVFKGVQLGDVGNIKMMSRNVSSHLCLIYLSFCVGF